MENSIFVCQFSRLDQIRQSPITPGRAAFVAQCHLVVIQSTLSILTTKSKYWVLIGADAGRHCPEAPTQWYASWWVVSCNAKSMRWCNLIDIFYVVLCNKPTTELQIWKLCFLEHLEDICFSKVMKIKPHFHDQLTACLPYALAEGEFWFYLVFYVPCWWLC